MEILLFLITVIICIFVLYVLSKQDFVLLRQNISLSEVFNLAILAALFGFFFARLFFIVTSSRFDLLFPLKFFHLLKFPGFSILGFFLGSAIYLFLALRKKKGLGRIYDIFAISFMPAYIFALFFRTFNVQSFVFPILLSLLMMGILIFFIRSHYKYLLRDGSLSFIFLFILSLDELVFQLPFIFSTTQIITIFLILVSLSGLYATERKK